MQNEAQLRQLIKQVSAMAKVPVSEDTVQDIVSAVKKWTESKQHGIINENDDEK